MGKLGSGPALDGAGGAGAFGVKGDEPDLIQSSADPGDGDRDLDRGLAGFTGGELFGHSFRGDAAGGEAGASERAWAGRRMMLTSVMAL